MRGLYTIITLIALSFASSTALATGSMRCGGKLIDQGASKSELLQRCGEPSLKKDAYWYYDRGSSIFLTRIFFVDEKIQFIDEVKRNQM
ncbi:MAG: DUF2845 domain-containing protein [Gammaproteobacteria bacterium]|nr:DUF2845 domain-containing protein [Gammaproteobacteria bacterium]